MFKLIAEAYEVLSNPETRRQYDRYGHRGVGSNAAEEEEFSNYRRSDKKSRRDPFTHFDENRAFDIFNHFFAEMGMDPFSDPFFTGGGGGGRARGNSRRSDPFSDPFFSGLGGFGGFGSGFDHDPFADFGGSSMSHFSSMSRNGSVMSGTSTSTTTVISADGTKKTRKETTVIHPDGRKETKVEEFTNDTRNNSNRLGYQQENPRITSDYRSSSSHRHSDSNRLMESPNRLSDSGARVMENHRNRSPRTSSRHASDTSTYSRSKSGQRY
jgi:curved DNA-binding protein CbpA